MSFEISGYVFEGPFSIPQDIEQESGVYLVLGLTEDHKAIVVEVGASDNIQNAVETHANKDCWEKLRGIALAFGYLLIQDSNGSNRSEIMGNIRSSNKTIF